MNKYVLISLLLFIISASVSAETDLAEIEAQERAKIISELTYGLETKQNCSATLIWDDSGSGANKDGYFFLPEVNDNEYIIGGHASGKRRSKYHCVTTVFLSTKNPEGTPKLLVKPADWKQVWKDSGSGAAKDGSFWQALPADDNYACIGSVSQRLHNNKPKIPNYRCVHKSLTEKTMLNGIVWSDEGSGSDQQVSIFSLPETGTYLAVSPRASKVEAYNLKSNAMNLPDEKQVEEILAKRMAPLKADIQAKAEAKALEAEKAKQLEEQKAAAKKAEAEKAEKMKLAAAKEKKQLEQQEQARQKELAAQKLKEEEQARIAKVEKEANENAIQKEITEKEFQEEPVQVNQIQSEKTNNYEAKPEPELEIEKELVTATSKSNGGDEPENESKGLNDILMFFLKIFGMMIGGVIIFMIAFKLIFGKKQ